MDNRERAVTAALRLTYAGEVEVRPLDVGDVEVRVDGRLKVVVERKSIADLAASIKDGRLYEQKARLKASVAQEHQRQQQEDLDRQAPFSKSPVILYVIEVGSGPSFCFDDARMHEAGVAGMSRSRLQGCVLSLVLGGTQTIFVRDVAETAALIRKIAERLEKWSIEDAKTAAKEAKAVKAANAAGAANARPAIPFDPKRFYEGIACVASAVRARKGSNVDPHLCYLQQLCQIPGISHSIATAIAAEYGTMGDLCARLGGSGAASDIRDIRLKALQSIPLVGPKIAARMCEVIFGDVIAPPPPKKSRKKGSPSEGPSEGPECPVDDPKVTKPIKEPSKRKTSPSKKPVTPQGPPDIPSETPSAP
jgi:ERCC4-type nuclease